ncbi:Ubiquitin-conjugating enzyme E2 7 [Camellia lanceoleosa]|uniref:Ubiquitin-conjugating enzyme E2 7 n=1 Tax=Camellia lanceoleosa TaxID=1840588 RepID=A0ACC0G5R2_9ERIC|nr:Ubiquitin-conjugating enzyme E2 7 [Camellia lanceoleosa]
MTTLLPGHLLLHTSTHLLIGDGATHRPKSSIFSLISRLQQPLEHTLVESIVLSIISMLSSPNDESPANVEAIVSATQLSYSISF